VCASLDSFFAPQAAAAAIELEKQALKAKEASLSKTEQAMETMKTVLDTRGEQLMQEREEQLLELLDSPENTEDAAGPTSATEPSSAEEVDDAQKKKKKKKKKKKDGDDEDMEEDDDDEEELTEEERMRAMEKAATAIGGE